MLLLIITIINVECTSNIEIKCDLKCLTRSYSQII